jgi:hypothetical protein
VARGQTAIEAGVHLGRRGPVPARPQRDLSAHLNHGLPVPGLCLFGIDVLMIYRIAAYGGQGEAA